ncbi:metallophosphoesterase [Leucobacter sp. M11]|uniref:metallophosphoesterase n=1 Tax=Leucobacter sp. M11 TaxID=2993565 RepID=UPI002D8091E3|nr:metallophosphoesterase [Leucobacter sp. M11]MEB4614408.1 metallophosphoesterase [Leucobacter sp. M11]
MSAESGRFTVLHLSDVHATETGLLYGRVDGLGRLRDVAEYARCSGITPEAVVITGDLAQRGNPGAYPAIAAACAQLEAAVAAPVYTVIGNHDDPVAARALPGHEAGHDRVHLHERFRFVLLDSHRGELSPEQLGWLRAVLAEDHGEGTILALHHAPMGSPIPTLQKQGLRNAAGFLDALGGSDVRLILAGHFHHPLSASVRGLPVQVAPSLAYHQVMNAGPDAVAGHDAPMFSLVQFTDEGVRATSLSLHTPDPLFVSPVSHPATPTQKES